MYYWKCLSLEIEHCIDLFVLLCLLSACLNAFTITSSSSYVFVYVCLVLFVLFLFFFFLVFKCDLLMELNFLRYSNRLVLLNPTELPSNALPNLQSSSREQFLFLWDGSNFDFRCNNFIEAIQLFLRQCERKEGMNEWKTEQKL